MPKVAFLNPIGALENLKFEVFGGAAIARMNTGQV